MMHETFRSNKTRTIGMVMEKEVRNSLQNLAILVEVWADSVSKPGVDMTHTQARAAAKNMSKYQTGITCVSTE